MSTPNSFLEDIRLLRRTHFGFTLVEMAVVIVIIALVGSLGFPGYAAVKKNLLKLLARQI